MGNYFFIYTNMIFVSIGIQGSGKWTQARLLQEEFGLMLFESGTALRNIAAEDSELGHKVKAIIDRGDHVSPAIIEDILKDILDNKSDGKVIFDGFIRNAGNKESFDKVVWDYKVLFFDLPKDEAVKRLIGRMYNPKTWETFPSWTETDPKTWDKLVKRADDQEEAIMKRIDLFVEKALPVVEECRKAWKVIDINANQPIADVYAELKKKLELN